MNLFRQPRKLLMHHTACRQRCFIYYIIYNYFQFVFPCSGRLRNFKGKWKKTARVFSKTSSIQPYLCLMSYTSKPKKQTFFQHPGTYCERPSVIQISYMICKIAASVDIIIRRRYRHRHNFPLCLPIHKTKIPYSI